MVLADQAYLGPVVTLCSEQARAVLSKAALQLGSGVCTTPLQLRHWLPLPEALVSEGGGVCPLEPLKIEQ